MHRRVDALPGIAAGRYIVAWCALCVACTRAGANTQAVGSSSTPSRRVSYVRLAGVEDVRYWSGLTDSVRAVIADSATWQELWDRIQQGRRPAAPLPRIDFRRDALVLAALGARGSTGYAITIDSVLQSADAPPTATVYLTKTRPASGSVVGAMKTAPLDVVRIPQAGGRATFVERWREEPSP